MTARSRQRIVWDVGIPQLLDDLPGSIAQRPGRCWNVFARSLGEQGAGGRTALAWRWALTGACPSPITLSLPPGKPPGRDELLAEAGAQAELSGPEADPGGQVMHARFVLQWLAGELDALPLWNGGLDGPHVMDGADYAHPRADIEQVYGWSLLARQRYPWQGEGASAASCYGFGWAFGMMQLLAWVCAEVAKGPLTGLRVTGRPSLYHVALDSRRAMTALLHAREEGQPVGLGRMEAVMETVLWLAGWNTAPPADEHGRGAFERRLTPASGHRLSPYGQ